MLAVSLRSLSKHGTHKTTGKNAHPTLKTAGMMGSASRLAPAFMVGSEATQAVSLP
jgi:hypothetical protein